MKIFLNIILLFTLYSCSTQESKEIQKENLFLKEFDTLPKSRGLNAEHYPTSNERRIDFFMPKIENLKGCYIGVGTDQNLSFIAKAKSEYAWLMDFDPVIVKVNLIHLYFLEISQNYDEFKSLWLRKNEKTSFELIKQKFGTDSEFDLIKKAWDVSHRNFSGVEDRLNELNFMTRKFGLVTFSNSPEEFSYLKKMNSEKRIFAVNGDLTGKITLKGISEVTKKINCPIRILYLSNAEEYFRYPEDMRSNFITLPSDSKGIVIRTMTSGTKQYFGWPEGEKFEDSFPLHYNIQPLQNFQKWMAFRAYFSTVYMLQQKRTTLQKGFSILETDPKDSGLTENGDIITKTKGMW